MDKVNLSIVRQSFANTVFTHKVHEIAAERQNTYSFVVKICNVVLVSIVLFFLYLQTKNPDDVIYSYIGAMISISEIVFLIVQLTFSFENRMVLHKNSALKFLGLRDAYRALIADIMNENIVKKEVIARRDVLQREYQIICELAPQTGYGEYLGAQMKLNKRDTIVEGEEFTWSDEEINRFLPSELKI
jgi:hypothetical protein